MLFVFTFFYLCNLCEFMYTYCHIVKCNKILHAFKLIYNYVCNTSIHANSITMCNKIVTDLNVTVDIIAT